MGLGLGWLYQHKSQQLGWASQVHDHLQPNGSPHPAGNRMMCVAHVIIQGHAEVGGLCSSLKPCQYPARGCIDVNGLRSVLSSETNWKPMIHDLADCEEQGDHLCHVIDDHRCTTESEDHGRLLWQPLHPISQSNNLDKKPPKRILKKWDGDAEE